MAFPIAIVWIEEEVAQICMRVWFCASDAPRLLAPDDSDLILVLQCSTYWDGLFLCDHNWVVSLQTGWNSVGTLPRLSVRAYKH